MTRPPLHQFSMGSYFAIERKLNTRYLNISILNSEKHFQVLQIFKLFIFFSFSRNPLVNSIWTLRCREPEIRCSTTSSASYSGDLQFLVVLMSVSLHHLSFLSLEVQKLLSEIEITHYFSCHRSGWCSGEDLLHHPGPARSPEVPGAVRSHRSAQRGVSSRP